MVREGVEVGPLCVLNLCGMVYGAYHYERVSGRAVGDVRHGGEIPDP